MFAIFVGCAFGGVGCAKNGAWVHEGRGADVENDGSPDDDISPEWTAMNSGTDEILFSVWGSSATDVYAVGSAGSVLRYDGDAWTIAVSAPECWFVSVWGSCSTDVFVSGYSNTSCCTFHYDGASWSPVSQAPEACPAGIVWGTSHADVFAAGNSGEVDHYDGFSWEDMLNAGFGASGLWGASASDVYLVGNDGSIGYVIHYDGHTWSSPFAHTTDFLPNSLWGTSATDIWATVSYCAVEVDNCYPFVRFDGSDWRPVDTNAAGDRSFSGIWGASPSDLFAVGSYGAALHGDGTTWSSMASGTRNELIAAWGSSATDVFAVGESGTILHYAGPPQ
jgi:hypothetical protein